MSLRFVPEYELRSKVGLFIPENYRDNLNSHVEEVGKRVRATGKPAGLFPEPRSHIQENLADLLHILVPISPTPDHRPVQAEDEHGCQEGQAEAEG